MKKMGHSLNNQQLKDILEKHNLKDDGYMKYDDFRQIFNTFQSWMNQQKTKE